MQRFAAHSLFLCTLLGCGGCGIRSEPSGQASPPSLELFGAESFDFRGDVVRAHGFADRVVFRRDTGDAEATRGRVEFPDRRAAGGTGAPSNAKVRIDAPRARGNPLDQRVDAEGGVRLVSDSGDHGTTERASYRGREGEAFGDRPVRLSGPGYQLSSPAFTLNTVSDQLDLGPATLLTQGRAH